ncbi:hypothetical protein VM1G_07547 [Cytospora mali]|uniref:Uncharacterized protein n=1 Tax=Cytospora mali TaxID=578113 RepID=A0A194W732_CYTMA|nr:hypothetical protein VM1G_07547 [Valsa mali]
MEGATNREREVANCLFQIEKLTDADARAVLRQLATDDATFSEAQCSHIARVVNGTLYKNPRDAVNASLTCASAFEAAVNWEKTFASYACPGHVSFGLRGCGTNDPDNMQTNVFLQQQPDANNDHNVGDDGMTVALSGPKDSFDSINYPGIINKGHMTVHYHNHHHHHHNDYKHSSSDQSIPSIVPQKRERDEEDEQYAEAMNALLGTYEPGADDMASTSPSKRARLQEPEAETHNMGPEPEPEKVKAEAEAGQLLLIKNSKTKTKTKTRTMQGNTCKYCGVQFTKRHNKPQRGGALPCRHHVGNLVPYPPGIKVGTNSSVKMLYQAWNCCGAAPADLGCVTTRHEAK